MNSQKNKSPLGITKAGPPLWAVSPTGWKLDPDLCFNRLDRLRRVYPPPAGLSGLGGREVKKGIVMVFTGNGKGKTTAALGIAIRAMGHGFKICMIQFIKGSWKYGELEAVKRFTDLMDFHVTGRGFTWKSEDFEKDKKAAREGWRLAKEVMASGKYRIIILDELTYLIKLNMIDEKEVVEAILNKPQDLHIVVTGRDAPVSLIDAADLVTELKAVKHPLEKGIKAQKGIEF